MLGAPPAFRSFLHPLGDLPRKYRRQFSPKASPFFPPRPIHSGPARIHSPFLHGIPSAKKKDGDERQCPPPRGAAVTRIGNSSHHLGMREEDCLFFFSREWQVATRGGVPQLTYRPFLARGVRGKRCLRLWHKWRMAERRNDGSLARSTVWKIVSAVRTARTSRDGP